MRTKSFLAACAASIVLAASGIAAAAPCAGFTDVDDTQVSADFCRGVEWLKNRQVTLGCPGVNLYCPNDPVARITMAAFMNRLGTALTPFELPTVTVAPAPRVLASNPVICATSDFVETIGFPRRAYVNAAAHLSVPTAGVDVMAQVVFSTNGGASWTPIVSSDQYATLYTGATPGNHATLAPFGWIDVNVGQTVRFGVHLGRFNGTGDVTAGCQNAVRIGNRNAATSPLDPGATPPATKLRRGS